MSRKKNDNQRQNANGNDKNKKVHTDSVGGELIENLNDTDTDDYFKSYSPETVTILPDDNLRTIKDKSRANKLYLFYVKDFYNMGVLFQPQDKIQVALMATLIVIQEDLALEAQRQPMLTKIDSDGFEKLIENPCLTTLLKLSSKIKAMLKDFGQLPSGRVDLAVKGSTIQQNQLQSGDNSKRSNDNRPKMKDFLSAGAIPIKKIANQ